MKTEVVIGLSDNMTTSAIDTVREAVKKFSPKAQAVHIIIASIIKTRKEWQTLIKVIAEPDKDPVPKEAITFCHLPYKYNDLYDDLLDEVDNINLIDDESIWENITVYLLDIIFYQAVHFQPLEEKSTSNGGYHKETKKATRAQPIVDELMDVFNIEKNYDEHIKGHTYNRNFQNNVEGMRAKPMESDYELYMRTGIKLDRSLKKK